MPPEGQKLPAGQGVIAKLLLNGQKFPGEQRDGDGIPFEGQKLPTGQGLGPTSLEGQ
jgi:hypothetical protein